MFPYRVKHNVSESDIESNNLLYKIDRQCQNTFDILEHFENIENQKVHFLFGNLIKLHK